MNNFERRQWQVKEYPFNPTDQPHMETIMTIGNGLVGTRGTFEEGYPGQNPTTLVAGVFNHKEGQLIPELVSMPNWLSMRFSIDGEICRMDAGIVLGFERTLDLKTATLRRGLLWLSPKGQILRLGFERFASLADPHLLAIRVLVQPLSEGEHTIAVYSSLDGTIYNPGLHDPKATIDHWAVLQGEADGDTLRIHGRTDQSGYEVAMHSRLQIEGASAGFVNTLQPRNPGHTATFTLKQNEQITVTKLVSVHSTRDSDTPAQAAAVTLDRAATAGYDAAKAAHVEAWTGYWNDFDIQIDGDEVAQRALRFCIYHVLIAAPTADERVSIGAKTLSGFGYRGHVFWDTELFMVPPMTLSRPEMARRLLMYRYHNLPGARRKAQALGLEGAIFPWESTDTGDETTPQWANDPNIEGKRIRIWTGDNEQHIATDVAYAVLQYWRWTGQDDWFADYGAEIVLDTAKFWGLRAEYNAGQDRYELRMQIGPDEYHENIDNSVFTNRLVIWHLEQALEVVEWLRTNRPADAQRLLESLGLAETHFEKWADIAQKMWVPMSDEGGGVFEQFENFFQRLQPINLQDYAPRTKNMDWIIGHERTQTTRVIKQADVVMLMALLGDQLGDREFLRRNWDLYSQVVDHGSSLSPAMHAWVAARLGLVNEAYDHFIYAATIDLEDHKGNVHDGIHAASSGGVWQAVVFGFCGLHLTEDGEVATDPHLPEHWRSVRFKVMHRGQPVEISLGEQVMA